MKSAFSIKRFLRASTTPIKPIFNLENMSPKDASTLASRPSAPIVPFALANHRYGVTPMCQPSSLAAGGFGDEVVPAACGGVWATLMRVSKNVKAIDPRETQA